MAYKLHFEGKRPGSAEIFCRNRPPLMPPLLSSDRKTRGLFRATSATFGKNSKLML
jgi:hypothetical protein